MSPFCDVKQVSFSAPSIKLVEELGTACDLDEVGDTWWRVARWYQQANDSKALAELRDRYRVRFGRELRAAR
jgi:hypothetical protein